MWAAVETLQTDVSTITADVTNLKNNELKITYYEIVSGASGTITPPTGATFNSDEFGNSGNSILSRINGANKPTYESPKTAGGVVVTANLNTTSGAWVASGTYTDTYVAIIYSINIKEKDYANLNNFYIIEETKLITVTDVTVSSPLASSGGAAPNITITQSGAATNGYLSYTDWNTFNNKQNTLVSGSTIKTINGTSLLGSGDITIASGITIGTTPITNGTDRHLFYNDNGILREIPSFKYDISNDILQYYGSAFQVYSVLGFTSVFTYAYYNSLGYCPAIHNVYGGNFAVGSRYDSMVCLDNGSQTGAVLKGLNFGIGTLSPQTRLHVEATTEQTRFGYNATNYLSINVGSTGLVTYDAVGSGAGFKFMKPVNLQNIPTSASGLFAGDIWNDSGTLKIV